MGGYLKKVEKNKTFFEKPADFSFNESYYLIIRQAQKP